MANASNAKIGVWTNVTRPNWDGETLTGHVLSMDPAGTHAYVQWDGWALPKWEPVAGLAIDNTWRDIMQSFHAAQAASDEQKG